MQVRIEERFSSSTCRPSCTVSSSCGYESVALQALNDQLDGTIVTHFLKPIK